MKSKHELKRCKWEPIGQVYHPGHLLVARPNESSYPALFFPIFGTFTFGFEIFSTGANLRMVSANAVIKMRSA